MVVEQKKRPESVMCQALNLVAYLIIDEHAVAACSGALFLGGDKPSLGQAPNICIIV